VDGGAPTNSAPEYDASPQYFVIAKYILLAYHLRVVVGREDHCGGAVKEF
jgi:hypothetical protein